MSNTVIVISRDKQVLVVGTMNTGLNKRRFGKIYGFVVKNFSPSLGL